MAERPQWQDDRNDGRPGQGPLPPHNDLPPAYYPDAAELRSDLRRLSTRLYFLTVRLGARRFLDLFRFGNGTAERLAAAVVLGSLFFFAILVVAIATATPLGYGLGMAVATLAVAWGTSAVFVLGPADEAVAAEADQKRAEALDRRAELLEVEAREAEVREAEAARREWEEREAARTVTPVRPPRRPPLRTARCPFCCEEILARAVKCKHCGELLDDELRAERDRTTRRKNFYPLAAFLSWCIPGLGQIVKGQPGRGLMWMGGVLAGFLCCGLPGVVLHVINIFDAAIYTA